MRYKVKPPRETIYVKGMGDVIAMLRHKHCIVASRLIGLCWESTRTVKCLVSKIESGKLGLKLSQLEYLAGCFEMTTEELLLLIFQRRYDGMIAAVKKARRQLAAWETLVCQAEKDPAKLTIQQLRMSEMWVKKSRKAILGKKKKVIP